MAPFTTIDQSVQSSNDDQPRRRIIAGAHLVLFFNARFNDESQSSDNTMAHIRKIVDDVIVFTQLDECIDFLTEIEDAKASLIIEDTVDQQVLFLIQRIPQLHRIYILCDSLSQRVIFREKKVVHANIDQTCNALKVDVKQSVQDSIPMSFIATDNGISDRTLDQLEPSFMYTQMFKEILIEVTYSGEDIKNFTTYWRGFYSKNVCELKTIDEFEHTYRPELAAWWYSRQFFLYSMINEGLRTLDSNIIINMGFFLHDLHNQIKQLHQQQTDQYKREPFTVYRGQTLSKSAFRKLQRIVGGLLSFNNFLSTSTNRDVSWPFAASASGNLDQVGVLFQMSINPQISTSPFASLDEVSYFKTEAEILFSMHTVFRVGSIKPMSEESEVYQVELELTADDDQQLRELTQCMSRRTGSAIGWDRMGSLLLTIGHFDKAEELYANLLRKASDEAAKAAYNHQLGIAYWHRGDNKKALGYLQKVLETEVINRPENYSSCANLHVSIGSVYDNMGQYSKSLSFYEKAIQIQEQEPSSNRPVLVIAYKNIAGLYNRMGEYSKSFSFHEKVLRIQETNLPANHPDLALSYNNIGLVYKNTGEYSKALSFYEKALQIQQKTLPETHHSLVVSYINMGTLYNDMGHCSKALLLYDKARQIQEKTLRVNHPDLSATYNSLGVTFSKMGEYPKALSFYEKAVQSQELLSTNHPSLAVCYNNMGVMYFKVGEWSKALSFHEKAIQIQQESLPANHPGLAISYNSIGVVYQNMGECSKAHSFYERAIQIQEKSLPATHPDLAITYSNMGSMYTSTRDYSKALSFHEKALQILLKAFPRNHSTVATLYNKIAMIYLNMKEWSKALPFYEKALQIYEESLPANHPQLAVLYNYLGFVHMNMRDWLKAYSFYDKALRIHEQTLPPTHLDLALCCKKIGFVCMNMREWSKALSYYENALQIDEKHFPAKHVSLAVSYNNIAWIFRNMKDYTKASLYYERALDIQKYLLPANHPDRKSVEESVESLKQLLENTIC